jgi:hypothetical protein
VAIDNTILRKTKTLKPVWKVLVNSQGSTGDIRYVMPALTYGLSGYINKDSKRKLGFHVEAKSLNEYVYDLNFANAPVRNVAGEK